MHGYFNFHSTDDEKRKLRLALDTVKRALTKQQEKNTRLEDENKKLKQEKKKRDKAIEKLKQENEKLRRERDMYRKMLFKENRQKQELAGEPGENSRRHTHHRGRKQGHIGVGRALPVQEPTQIKRVFFTHCPTCQTPLKRTDSLESHTVEDIPAPQTTPVIITRYEKERQWCSQCQKAVIATAPEEIPGSRFGIHLTTYLLLLKYGCRLSLEAIALLLEQTYNLRVSSGALIQQLHRSRKYLAGRYDLIRDAVRASPVKFADETGWRVNGQNSWAWDFLTPKEVYLTIEQSRGGGVPKEVLQGVHPEDVLVRDDYTAYKNLPLKHQSCWAHLLRKSHEAAVEKTASAEVKKLHTQLKRLFPRLKQTVSQPFNRRDRERVYQDAWASLSRIIATPYTKKDAQDIQTRMRNQGKNLLTALLHENVPLTNNLAERSIRPLVVQRKISGGSRSWEGAKTTAVNTSVYQTIQLQQLPLMSTLKEYYLDGIGKR